MRISHHTLTLETDAGICVYDITPMIKERLARERVAQGFVIVATRHTTTAVRLNEAEERLLHDIKLFLEKLVPPGEDYSHNDIHLRDCPPDESENAHAHLAALLLGSSEAIPVIDGKLALGTWQSVLFLELDGPRRRTVTVQVCGDS